jgi:hypothetical protein
MLSKPSATDIYDDIELSDNESDNDDLPTAPKRAKTASKNDGDSGTKKKNSSKTLAPPDAKRRSFKVSTNHMEQWQKDAANHPEYQDLQDYTYCFDCDKPFFTKTQHWHHRRALHSHLFAYTCGRCEYECDNNSVFMIHDMTMHALPAVKHENQELKQINEALMVEVNRLRDELASYKPME